MIFFARRNYLLDNMAVKKNARREIAASLKKAAGSCWEDSGNSWDGKTAAEFINKNPRRKAWATVFRLLFLHS